MKEDLVNQFILTVKDFNDDDKQLAINVIDCICNCCELEDCSELSFAKKLTLIINEMKESDTKDVKKSNSK